MQALRTAALLLFIALGAAADDGARFRAELVGTQEVPAIFAAGTAIFEMRVPKIIDGSYASGGSMRIVVQSATAEAPGREHSSEISPRCSSAELK